MSQSISILLMLSEYMTSYTNTVPYMLPGNVTNAQVALKNTLFFKNSVASSLAGLSPEGTTALALPLPRKGDVSGVEAVDLQLLVSE